MIDPELLTAFVTLFVIVDPVGLAPLFVALTQGMDRGHRRMIAVRACVIGFGVLVVFALAGETLLQLVGISMPAFRIAGGILLFLTALDMLFERRTRRRSGQTATAHDPSVFPLATPLIAGPGAIATMILLTGQQGADAAWIVSVLGVLLAVILIVFVLFLAAVPLEHLLGPTGINVVTRLLGMLLAALSVQFVLDGLIGAGLVPGG